MTVFKGYMLLAKRNIKGIIVYLLFYRGSLLQWECQGTESLVHLRQRS